MSRRTRMLSWAPWILWAAALVGLVSVAAVRWRRPMLAVDRSNLRTLLDTPSSSDFLVRDDSTDLFGGSDPFRLSKTPSHVRYAAGGNALVQATSLRVREPMPTLKLRAIAGGPPWQALIEGLPGQTRAVLVRSGNTFDRVTIRVVARDSVVVHVEDSTWALRFANRS